MLIVEDDPAARDVLERRFAEAMIKVEAVPDGVAAEARAAAGGFDAIVLDVVLPGHDGFTVCRRLRARGVDTPILLLTGRLGLDDRVRGLDAGADDYLVKPYAFEELMARLRALTRRGRTRHLDAVLRCGGLEFDRHDRRVTLVGEPLELTATELRLLEYMLLHADELVTRDDLARHVWGDHGALRSNVIDVYIGYLRKKLRPAGSPVLRTVRKLGYSLRKGPTGDAEATT